MDASARGLLKDAIEHVEREREKERGSLGAIIAVVAYIREKKRHLEKERG